MDAQLSSCDLCIREYYIGKMNFRTQLLQEFDEGEVEQFLTIITQRDIQRIQSGLDSATMVLANTPEAKRHMGILDTSQLFALFEALHCEPFFTDAKALEKHFDKPFKLVQSKRDLRITDILPAVTRFLFSTDNDRLNWALKTWQRLGRSPTNVEWDWSIKDTIVKELEAVRNDTGLVRYWNGLKMIISKLSSEQVRHKLFALGFNVSKLFLDHLARNTMALPQITQSLADIMRKSPDAYWTALVDVSANVVAEVIFNTKNFDKCLDAQAGPEHTGSALDVLSWIDPFIEGLSAATRPAAARTVVDQLVQRLRAPGKSDAVKQACFDAMISVLLTSVQGCASDDQVRLATARPVLSDILALVGKNMPLLLTYDIKGTKEKQGKTRKLMLSLLKNSLSLEGRLLRDDFESINNKKPAAQSSSYTSELWVAAIQALHPTDVQYSIAILEGTMSLAGMEKFVVRPESPLSQEKQSFNDVLEKIEKAVCETVEQLSDYPSQHLQTLFGEQNSSMALIACLFSSYKPLEQATTELIKNVNGMSARKEGLADLLNKYLSTTCYSFCWVFRRVSNTRAFSPIPRLLSIGKDVMEILCDSSGIVRARSMDHRDNSALQQFWSYSWLLMGTIFSNMEPWSIAVHDKKIMTDVCRETMEYARELFGHYYLFVKIASAGKSEADSAKIPDLLLNTGHSVNSGSPVKAFDVMVKWLRLRDSYLVEVLVDLVIEMLSRLKDYGTELSDNNTALSTIERLAAGNSRQKGPKTNLSEQQKAALIRALESYTGRQIAPKAQAIKKQQRLDQWTDRNESKPTKLEVVTIEDEFDDIELNIDDFTKLEKEAAQRKLKSSVPTTTRPDTKSNLLPTRPVSKAASYKDVAAKQAETSRAFIEKRKAEIAAKKARDKELAAKRKGTSALTMNAGSGLAGLGVEGKDHSTPRSDLMVSSSSESESSDEELFGKTVKKPATINGQSSRRAEPTPLRKIKQVRSAKDMRARLAPDLTGLHKTILSWDFFADTDTPPSSDRTDYSLVTNTFKTVQDYQRTFEPLLVLEGWQSFRSAREDGNFKPFEIKVASSLIVDNFFELNTQISLEEGRNLGLSASDVVLLSKDPRPHTNPDAPHCLARVKEVTRKRGEMQIVYRVASAGNPMRTHLNDKATVYGISILSLTPIEREYGALVALPYYDLADEVIGARPSPLLDYKDDDLVDIRRVYNVNTAQAKAVKSAIDNDAFTLVQGPPGSGKTKTICAIVGAIMTNAIVRNASQSARKVLVCAPSNAAVDELVMRFKNGIKLMNGSSETINVVRLGRSDAINAAVKDVTLEELVNAKLSEDGTNTNGKTENTQVVMMEHKKVSEEMIEVRQRIDEARSKAQAPATKDEQLLDSLRRTKTALSVKIDQLREKQSSASREFDINRKRVQQQILDSAHILCATLSGSGHEIFQGLNVEFETVIIDEAAQSIELSALIPLKYGCAKCILVGDPKQLPPTVLSRQAAKFQYEQSLFARMEGNHPENVHLLDIQYRMHPEISAWPSKTFYDSRLRDGGDMAQLRARPWHRSQVFSPYRFFDVNGMSESAPKGRSLVNHAEIEVAMAMYHRLISDVPKYDFVGKIGIITPYKGQLNALRQRFTAKYGSNITADVEFNTTDAFQGRESEVIIFSCVRADTKGIGFLKDVRRMNVGLTRAKSSLWVLGNSKALAQGEFWSDLISDARKRSLYTEGNIMQLLRRPLLTQDMIRDDVDMGGMDETPDPGVDNRSQNPRTSTARARPQSNGASEEESPATVASGRTTPLSKDGSPWPTHPQSFAPQQDPVVADKSAEKRFDVRARSADSRRDPDGGAGDHRGPKSNPSCNMCGASKHITYKCDHAVSRADDASICLGCKQNHHPAGSCPLPRCLACGDAGHAEQACTVEAGQSVKQQQGESVRRQDLKRKAEATRTPEHRAKKQFGDRGATIPAVQSIVSSVPVTTSEKRLHEKVANATARESAPIEQEGTGTGPSKVSLHARPTPSSAAPVVTRVIKRKPKQADMFFGK